MTAYYNEIDPFAAEWLKNLITFGHIAYGHVDTRSISEVTPNDLHGFTQCHFFAGVGVWSHALRLSGWPDDRPVWTGSCPCQPFSSAGKGEGFADERHLWPHFHHLIEQCRPPVVFGEQVASKDGLEWLDLVCADLEGSGYACAAADLCAAGLGAPHIRQRLYWVGHSIVKRLEGHTWDGNGTLGWAKSARSVATAGELGGVGNSPNQPCERDAGSIFGAQASEHGTRLTVDGAVLVGSEYAGSSVGNEQPRPTNGFWRDADWLLCRDGKWRPVEPGTFPLAHGAAARVGRLRAYGNAIVPQVAQAFIEAYIEAYIGV